jgi:transposase
MILRNEEERYVEEETQGSREDRRVEAVGGGEDGRGCRRELDVSKHTIYAWKARYRGLDVGQA